MNDIPILGWVCLGSIVFMVLGLYLSLFAAWRRKDQKPPDEAIQGNRIINALRKPWAREDSDWEKLHSQAEQLRKDRRSPPQE